jgi:hypothetical protein
MIAAAGGPLSMGWLRDLMGLCSPPIDGYGELARRVLAHPEWPREIHPQARSLAALFSKLDRGIELEWLADRDPVQRCLALVLGCPIETVRRVAEPDPQALGHGRLRFEDLPYARPFDLREDALPPGIPERVLSPSAWQRLWWDAPSGSGRSLVGQWLAARGLARFVSAPSWRDVVDRLPGSRPLYLELERGDDLDGLEGALPDTGSCVAAPAPPPPNDAGRWIVIDSPPVDGVLPALMSWIEARVPSDGSFDPAAAEAWLRPPIAAGELTTLGAVLGAAGLLDARGVRQARGRTLTQLAESFVNERLARASAGGSEEARWLERFGFRALVQLAQSALTASDVSWTLARSEDEWIALVPVALGAGSGTARAAPGAFRIVRALIDAGLLAERTPHRFALAPEFLKHVVLVRAREALVREGSPFEWGEALLRPHAAPGVLDELYRRFASDDFGALEQVAELDAHGADAAPSESSHPALIVAGEACLVCCGLRASCGAEVPLDLLEAIWNAQLAWLVELPGELPRPRLLCTTAADSSPLARHPVWMLGLLAASESFGDRQGRAHALLRPWGAPPSPEQLRPMLDAIYAELGRSDTATREWAVEAFALAARLLEHESDEDESAEAPAASAGDSDRTPSSSRSAPKGASGAPPPHPLVRPARLARAVTDGEVAGAWLPGFGSHPLELPALSAACALRHVAWPRMAHALWKTWQSRGCPADQDVLLAPGAAGAAQLWPHLPPEVLGTAWVRWTGAQAWPLSSFGPMQWAAFVEYFGDRWHRAPTSAVWPAAFESMDLACVERAVECGQLLRASGPEVRPLLERIWQRFPSWLLTRLRELAASGDGDAVSRLLLTAPLAREAEIVRTLAEELSRRSTQRSVIDGARAWLYGKVAARRGEWRGAYSLLAELERRLARAERARGALRELER